MAKYKKIYISIILGLILLVSGLFYLHSSTQKVGAESPEAYIITDGCFDCYTDSEYFYDSQTKQEDRTKELKNYPKYFSNRFKSNVEGKTDEWILGFVPEDLFIHIGQYFYIGRTYGFFIDNKGSEQFIYLFDIIIGTNEVSDGCIEVKLMPFFYHTYYYNQGEITIRSYEEDNFVIKDVSFGAGLSNITYANKGDETYNANNDNGSFLIASEYYYNGRSLKEDLSQPEETGRKIFSSLTVGALKMGGKLYPPLAVVGTVFDIALKIPDLVQSGLEFYENSKMDYAVTKTNDSFRGELYHTTKQAQLEGTSELSGYPDGLRKMSLLKMETDLINPVLYEPNKGHYVQGKYVIGTTEHWKTKFIGRVGLDIMKETVVGNETIVEFAYENISSNCFSFNFWEDMEKPQKYTEGLNTPIDLLQNNTKQIEVIANNFTGKYIFEADGAKISIYDDTTLLDTQIDRIEFDLEENTSAFIEITPSADLKENNLHTMGKFYFKPSALIKDSPENITLLEQKKYTYSYITSISNVYNINTNNKNISIIIYENGVKTYEAIGKDISFICKANKEIYIEFINNINESQTLNIELSIGETYFSNQNEKYELQGKEIGFYNFNFVFEGNYSIKNPNTNLLFQLIDENGTVVNELIKQKTYFIKVTNLTSSNISTNITVEFDPISVNFGKNSKKSSIKYVKFYSYSDESYVFENIIGVYDYNFSEIDIINGYAYLTADEEKCYYLECENSDYIDIEVPFISIEELEKEYSQKLNQNGQNYYKIVIEYAGKYEIFSSHEIILYNANMEVLNSYSKDCKVDLSEGEYYIKFEGKESEQTTIKLCLAGQTLVIDQEHILGNNGSTIFKFTPEYSEMYVFLTRGDVNNTLSNKITLYEIEDGALSEKASADYNKYVQLKISLKANSIYYIKVDIKNANNQALIFWAEYAEKTHESNYTAEREIQTGTGIIRQKIKVNQSTIIRFISPEEGTYRFFVDKKIEDSTYDVCLFIGEQINGKKLEVSKIYDNSTVNEYLITCNSGITYYFVVSNINDTIEPAINFSIVKAYENISLKIRLDEEGRNFYNNDSDIVEVAICNRYELGLCAGNQLLANSLIYSITSGSMYATLDENLITINGNGLNQTITLAVSYYYSTYTIVLSVCNPITEDISLETQEPEPSTDQVEIIPKLKIEFVAEQDIISKGNLKIDILFKIDKQTMMAIKGFSGDISTAEDYFLEIDLTQYWPIDFNKIEISITYKNSGEQYTYTIEFDFDNTTITLENYSENLIKDRVWLYFKGGNTSTSVNKTVNIQSSVKAVTFVGNSSITYSDLSINVMKREDPLWIFFKNFNYVSLEGSPALKSTGEGKVYIECRGIVQIKGHDGKDGANGTAILDFNCGEKGKAGQPGTVAISVENALNLYGSGSIFIIGGNGGDGGNGRDGRRGADGANGNNNSDFSAACGGWGERGGGGGMGGRGGDAAPAIVSKKVTIKVIYSPSSNIRLSSGMPGDGGDGGDGMAGGQGGNGANTAKRKNSSSDAGWGGDGGDGGLGGHGGDGGSSAVAIQADEIFNLGGPLVLFHSYGGEGGNGGNGGNGGRGGTGGDDTRLSGSEADGGNGGDGGDGGCAGRTAKSAQRITIKGNSIETTQEIKVHPNKGRNVGKGGKGGLGGLRGDTGGNDAGKKDGTPGKDGVDGHYL